MVRFVYAAAAAAAVLGFCLFAFLAFAHADGTPIDQAIADACADNGAFLHWVVGVFGTVVGASAIANFRKVLPAPLAAVIDAVALNFIKSKGATLSSLLAVAIGGALLAGCAATTLQTKLAAINSDLSTFNSNLNADIGVISAQGLPALCSAAKVLDAGFNDLAPLSTKLQTNAAAEKAAYAVVAAVCAAPPTDAASLAATAVSVAVQVKTLQTLAKAAN
jgi:hypothetical protein